jgi:hypothetical protein
MYIHKEREGGEGKEGRERGVSTEPAGYPFLCSSS